MSSVVLKPVTREGFWCVKMTWRKKTPRYFGRFASQVDAEQWIEKHHWMIEQRQEPGAAEADDPDDTSPAVA
jgi:hypothetical protein